MAGSDPEVIMPHVRNSGVSDRGWRTIYKVKPIYTLEYVADLARNRAHQVAISSRQAAFACAFGRPNA
jgi:hypothetical protein